MLASFLCKYANGYMSAYRQAHEGLVDKSDSNKHKLYFNSKLEGDNNSLLDAINHFNNKMHTNYTKLDSILKKFDLTENFQT